MIRREFLVDKLPYHIDNFNKRYILEIRINESEFIEQIGKEFFLVNEDEKKTSIKKISNFQAKRSKKNSKLVLKTRYFIPLTSEIDALIDMYNDGTNKILVDFIDELDATCFIIPDWFGAEIINDFKVKRKSK